MQSNPGAEYGVRGASVINVGLKSGTNQLHGSAFWDRHTDAFDARNYFATAVTPFRLNQYGATVGFPIKKDKTFGIVSFQGFHLKDVFPSLVDVPAPSEIFDARQCVITGVNPDTAGSGLPCLNIGPGPGSDQIYGTADDGTVNSIGDALLSFIPTSPTGKLNVRAENVLDLTSFHVKVDHIFNQSQRVSVKYLFSDSFDGQAAFALPSRVLYFLGVSTAGWWNERDAQVFRSPQPDELGRSRMDHQPHQGVGKPHRLHTFFAAHRNQQQH